MRVEPKFFIPSGDPYNQPWCRPQNDGPALRAMALAQYGTILDAEGMDTARIWGLIQTDLVRGREIFFKLGGFVFLMLRI